MTRTRWSAMQVLAAGALLLSCVVLPSSALMLGYSELSREFRPLAQLPRECIQPPSYVPINCTEDAAAQGTEVWYYDLDYKTCRSTRVYHSCDTQNRFPSMSECDERCLKAVECPAGCELVRDGWRRGYRRCHCPEEISSELCSPPVDEGSCGDAAFPTVERFYFDSSTKECKVFEFSRCQGNSNNFGTSLKCRDICMYNPDYRPSENNYYIKAFLIFFFAIAAVYIFRDPEYRQQVKTSVMKDVGDFVSSHKKQA